MSNFYNEKPFKYVKPAPATSEDVIVKDGWSVKKDENKYVLDFISGELAGKLKRLEISHRDFELVKKGEIGLDELCAKYGVS